jgi:hypothetical protein
MKLTLNIKPNTIIKTYKPHPTIDIVWGLSLGFTTKGVNWGYYDNEYAYGFVFQKVRRKMKTTKRVKKVWEGKEVWTNKRTYEPAKWVVSYYKIPLAVLKVMNLTITQKNRHFTIIKKSK